jgi:hypothetical protein
MKSSMTIPVKALWLILAVLCAALPASAQEGDGLWPVQIVLVQKSGDDVQAYRAVEVKKGSDIYILRNDEGKQMGWQADFVRAVIPAYPDDDRSLSVDQLREAVETITAAPENRVDIESEIRKAFADSGKKKEDGDPL